MQNGMNVPGDRSLDECTVELVEMLGHSNPRWREDLAYPLLTTWVTRGSTTGSSLSGLGDGIAPGLRSAWAMTATSRSCAAPTVR